MAGWDFCCALCSRSTQQDKLLHEGATVPVASQGFGSVVETDCYYCIFNLEGLRLTGLFVLPHRLNHSWLWLGKRDKNSLPRSLLPSCFRRWTWQRSAVVALGSSQASAGGRQWSQPAREKNKLAREPTYSAKKGLPQRTGATVNPWQAPHGILLHCTSFPIQAELSAWACASLTCSIRGS